MTAFHAFGRGWTAASRSKVALLLMWFTYALIAKIVAVPAVIWLLAQVVPSRIADKLLAHFDVTWIGDLADSATPAVSALAGSAALAAALTWLAAVLFAGGVLAMLNEHWQRFSFSRFLASAGEYFWRILRLSLFGLVCYGLAWAVGRVPSLLANKIYGKGMEGWPIGVAGIAGSVLTALLFGWVATVLDYAKLRLVTDNVRGAFKALLRSFAFVFRHFWLTMSVWLMNAILFALLGAVYLLASKAIHASGTWTILLLIVVQQLFVFFRTAQRIAGWGAALAIYAALKEPPLEPELVVAWTGGAPPERRSGVEVEPPEWDGFGI
ncbi:MAG: hypothetical protein P4K98_06695 [Bryobacteraceae bacterium]|nr:hypothetical protein [Bryobacteraceae bacterium]